MPPEPNPPPSPAKRVSAASAGLESLNGLMPEILAELAKAKALAEAQDAERAAKGLPPRHTLADHRPARVPRPAAPKAQAEAERPPPAKKRDYRQPDDATRADVTWLQLTVGSVTALKTMNWAWAGKQGFTRGHWRQAVAHLIAMAPGRVEDPCGYVARMARSAAKREAQDPRATPGYCPMITWGGAALRVAGVVDGL